MLVLTGNVFWQAWQTLIPRSFFTFEAKASLGTAATSSSTESCWRWGFGTTRRAVSSSVFRRRQDWLAKGKRRLRSSGDIRDTSFVENLFDAVDSSLVIARLKVLPITGNADGKPYTDNHANVLEFHASSHFLGPIRLTNFSRFAKVATPHPLMPINAPASFHLHFVRRKADRTAETFKSRTFPLRMVRLSRNNFVASRAKMAS